MNYMEILDDAYARPAPAERASGCCRVYVVIADPSHVDGVACAAAQLGRVFQRKGHYGVRNALYIGYDNFTGREQARGTVISNALNAAGIAAYRDAHED